jgi:hypothetical protein
MRKTRQDSVLMPKLDPINFVEDAEAFFTMLVQFVELKEGRPHNHDYQWSVREVLYVRAAMDEMTQDQRSAFQERFKDYQITKIISLQRQGSA